MTRILRCATACALALAARAGAQDTVVSIHGSVVAAGDAEPLPFATVNLDSGTAAVFGDSTGHFRIPHVSPGRHHLSTRELGYAPSDTVLGVSAGQSADIVITLTRVPHVLPPVTARGDVPCRSPGVTDTAMAPELATLATQLVANAERVRLLAKEAPYEYWVEATIATHYAERPDLDNETIDTLVFSATERHVYRPGDIIDARLVGRRVTRGYGGPYIYLPDLEDLAEPSFLTHHCFTFGGVDSTRGEAELRVDFRPLDRMRAADAEGSFYLDPQRFTAKRAVIWLTRGDHQVPPIWHLEARIWYREIAPFVVVEDSARFEQTSGSAIAGGQISAIEHQRVVDFRTRKSKPHG